MKRGLMFAFLVCTVSVLLEACASSANTMRCPGARRNPPKHFSYGVPAGQVLLQQAHIV